jgi:hypothetical protein
MEHCVSIADLNCIEAFGLEVVFSDGSHALYTTEELLRWRPHRESSALERAQTISRCVGRRKRSATASIKITEFTGVEHCLAAVWFSDGTHALFHVSEFLEARGRSEIIEMHSPAAVRFGDELMGADAEDCNRIALRGCDAEVEAGAMP